MKKSAMALAFQALRRKPMVLLLLLPAPVISVLVSAISLQTMPDFSKLFDLSAITDYSSSLDALDGMRTSTLMSVISMLVSSVSFLLSAVSTFLLVPPAMELLRDGAAGAQTAPGWYLRGLRSHWWKPITDSVITGGIAAILIIPLYIVFFVVMMVSATGMAMGSASSYDYGMSGFLSFTIVAAVIFILVIYALIWIIDSVFGLFLPALADRSFGEAFKLLFSKKGFRKLPRMMGGQLLIALVPGVFYGVLCVAYLLIMGVPQAPMGILAAMTDFAKSWAGILGLLVTSIFTVLTYAFRFGVHQLIRDEEERQCVGSPLLCPDRTP